MVPMHPQKRMEAFHLSAPPPLDILGATHESSALLLKPFRAAQVNSSRRLRVLIVPDKFKGTLSAGAAAAAIARGWRKARPRDRLILLPMSDGGDGFGEVISGLLNAKPQTISAIDAARRPCAAHWWWEPKTRTAIIESAKLIGLAMLPPKEFHPYALDTAGLGAIIPALAAAGAKRCLAGIGGSATNDGGFGLARALGWEFLDRAGCPLSNGPPWTSWRASALPAAAGGSRNCGSLWTSRTACSVPEGQLEFMGRKRACSRRILAGPNVAWAAWRE